jgi:hypothetical protein
MSENEILDSHLEDRMPVLDAEGLVDHNTSAGDFLTKLTEFFRPYVDDAIESRQLDYACFFTAKLHLALYLAHPDLLSIFDNYVFEIFEILPFINESFVKLQLNEYAANRLKSYGFALMNPDCYYYPEELADRFRKIEIPEYQQIMMPFCISQVFNKPFLLQDFHLIKRLLRYVTPLKSITDDDDLCFYPDHVLSRIR